MARKGITDTITESFTLKGKSWSEEIFFIGCMPEVYQDSVRFDVRFRTTIL